MKTPVTMDDPSRIPPEAVSFRLFNEEQTLHRLKHYLPAQAPLKDFIHHNTLHAFQHEEFFQGLRQASEVFGYNVLLTIAEYRRLFKEVRIRQNVFDRILENKKGSDAKKWKHKLLHFEFDDAPVPRVGRVRARWKTEYALDMDTKVHPKLFRTICSYLDQGIAMWKFPVWNRGFLSSLKEMEHHSMISLFRTGKARDLLLHGKGDLKSLLKTIVGDEALFEPYLFDQQFAHPGWSGIVSSIEDQPQNLLDHKKISLYDFIYFELLLEIDTIYHYLGEDFVPLAAKAGIKAEPLLEPVPETDRFEALTLWQQAFEWSFFDDVLAGMQQQDKSGSKISQKSFQAMFCLDDRECSLRRYLEKTDSCCETYGTPGFFGVEFFFKPAEGKFYTKLCPAPVDPKYLIKEVGGKKKQQSDPHFTKHSHSLFRGWLITQTLGLWSAVRLFFNIFRPSVGPASATSFQHMDQTSKLTIETAHPEQKENGLQIGFTVDEMATRVENLLRSIGMVNNFAPIVYVVGHGASSVNNPHYAAYDCGACAGRPGSVNARVFSHMANHKGVRAILEQHGISIPQTTQFVGGIHDTTRDDIMFFDEDRLNESNRKAHERHHATFLTALDLNAKERSRRFELIDSAESPVKIHERVRRRSVSLFEPRPELNHATNAICIIGRRELSRGVFLDRRSFLNSFDYRIDPEGDHLYSILKAAAPVCGGINLEYFFSRVDNQVLGAGTKLPHNVMGLFGVANGIDGDLRPGLPSQMIEVHDPVRLLTIVEHFPDVVRNVIRRDESTHEWFRNEWIYLVAMHPESEELFLYSNGEFVPYKPLNTAVEKLADITPIIESTLENLPVYVIS